MSPRFALLPLLAASLGMTSPVLAEIRLASPFTDHAVLQRELPVPVWGTADAGSTIKIEFAGQAASAVTDAAGKWRLALRPLAASAEGREMKVSSSEPGVAPVMLRDVLVGEVWLASGQSNMDFSVAKTPKRYFAGVRDEAAEIAAADHPTLRMFTGEWTLSQEPRGQVAGEWKICNPENVRDFSAVAYFFARDLQRALNVPVGIVTLAYGASTAQAWIQREAIAANSLLKPALDEFDAKVRSFVPPTETELKEWREAVDRAKAAGVHAPRRPGGDPVQDQHHPTVLFNGMVAPTAPYALRGVIWYQGESITGPKELFPLWNETLIKNWRALWGRDLPFYFCQLAAYKGGGKLPAVREQQAEALKLPGTGMAVTIDIGDEKDVHPKNKQDVGNRLSRLALVKTYGREGECDGPRFERAKVEGDAMRLIFSHLGGGLIAKDGPLRAFEIAGADGKYFPAEAVITGEDVIVRSADVTAPKSARYAWANFPAGCNFYNRAGLPAAPFRTDNTPDQ